MTLGVTTLLNGSSDGGASFREMACVTAAVGSSAASLRETVDPHSDSEALEVPPESSVSYPS